MDGPCASGPLRSNADGVGLDGCSPVAYFDDATAAIGNPQYSATVDGVTYWLRSAEKRQRFEASPSQYLPAHGGWCTLMMGGSGRRTPGHPESFTVVDGRLLLFWSGDTPETAGMGLTNWQRKTGGDEARARAWLRNADAQWHEFLRGDRRSPIYLYKASDAQAVSAGQLAEAVKEYEN